MQKPKKADMAPSNVRVDRSRALLLVGVLLSLVLSGCTGNHDDGEDFALTLEPPGRPLIVGEQATFRLHISGPAAKLVQVGLAHANTSTNGVQDDLLVEAAFDSVYWSSTSASVPTVVQITLEATPEAPQLYLRGAAETERGTIWSDELRLDLQTPEPPPVPAIRLDGLPTTSYHYNLHDVQVNVTGVEADASETGFAWSNTSTAHRDNTSLRPARFDGHLLQRDSRLPGTVSFANWSVPTNITLHLRAWVQIDGTRHWSNEHVLASRDPPLVDQKVSQADHLVQIEPALLPVPHLDHYAPEEIEIQRGETVQWINQGHSGHTASHTANTTAFHTGNLAPGVSSGTYRFLVPGEYPYHCRIHPETMQGTIVVTG